MNLHQWFWSALSKITILIILMSLNKCENKEVTEGVFSKGKFDLKSKIKYIEKKLNDFKGENNKFILNSYFKKIYVQKFGILNAEKFEKKIKKIEKRIVKEKDFLSKQFNSFQIFEKESTLIEFIEYYFYVFSQEKLSLDLFSNNNIQTSNKRGLDSTEEDEQKTSFKMNNFCWQNITPNDSNPNHNKIDIDYSNNNQNKNINPNKNSQNKNFDGYATKILYEGVWTSDEESQNNFLSSKSGKFLGMLSFTNSNQAKFIFQIYESFYIDSPTLISNINLNIENKNQSQFNLRSYLQINRDTSLFNSKMNPECFVELELGFKKKLDNSPV